LVSRKTLEVGSVVGLLCIASIAGIALFYLHGAPTTTGTSCGPFGCTSQSVQYSTSVTTSTTTETATVTSTVVATTTITDWTTSTATTTETQTGGNSTLPSLGFWVQEQDIVETYTPAVFFHSMFFTPPFPSSLEVMVFAILQDEKNGDGCSANSPYVASSLSYWGQVASMANHYPIIRLMFEIAFDPSSGGSGTYGLGCFNTVTRALGQYSSVYGIGVEGEYVPVSQGMTEAEMQAAMTDVTATGKLFINYYPPVPVPTGGYYITHTNFPGGDAGGYDQVGTLQNYDSQTVGLDSGYYSDFQFPGTATCPLGPLSMNNATAGWNQCIVSTELSAAVNFRPASARQFLELVAGFSASGSFVGVSGQTTSQLWDNAVLRSWIWTDPDYLGNFTLSL